MSQILAAISADLLRLERETRSDSSQGALWSLSTNNHLAGLGAERPAWLLPTHHAWGRTDSGDHAAAAQQAILSTLTSIIASATTIVDIAGMSKVADGGFREAIIEGARQAYANGHRPLIRLLWGKTMFGSFLQGDYGSISGLVEEIAAQAPGVPVVAALTNFKEIGEERSWNHAKIVAADGRVAMVGGMNLWSADYLDTATPVTDLNLEVHGPAARDAQRFLNELWTYVQSHASKHFHVVDATLTPTFVASAAVADQDYVRAIPEPYLDPVQPAEAVPILSVARAGLFRNGRLTRSTEQTLTPQDKQFSTGRFWDWISEGGVLNQGDPQWDANNPGDTALRSLVRQAQREIVITQQMLEFKALPIGQAVFDFRLYKALAERIVAGVKVEIVTSNLNASGDYKANDPQESWNALSALVYRTLQESADHLALDHTDLVSRSNTLMASNLSIKSLGLSPLQNWPGQSKGPGLHSKVISVDDATFYVGSQNAYPSKHPEFGYIIDSPVAAADLNRTYLDPMLLYSKPFAIRNDAAFVTLLPKRDVVVGDDRSMVFNAADGDDSISGGAGDDHLRGGRGRDVLTGGPGADVFVYADLQDSTPRQSGRDLIVDFDPKLDRLDFSRLDANTRLPGRQSPIWSGRGSFSGRAGELIAQRQGQHLLLRLDADGDRSSDFEIALLNLRPSHELANALVGVETVTPFVAAPLL